MKILKGKGLALMVFSILLSLWSLALKLSTVHIVISLLAFLGAALAIAGINYGYWLVILFYALQVIAIYGFDWALKFQAGFSFPVFMRLGANGPGISINILASILLWLVINQMLKAQRLQHVSK